MLKNNFLNLYSILKSKPNATATIKGSRHHPHIYGTVNFYQAEKGVIVATEVSGLPNPMGKCQKAIFGFHLHSGNSCTGNESDPFANAGTHYNPHNCPHPYHSGDFPSLFGNNGYAVSLFLTDRFDINEIIGKAVVIHSSPDDFKSQPAGNAGTKIACGIIKRLI